MKLMNLIDLYQFVFLKTHSNSSCDEDVSGHVQVHPCGRGSHQSQIALGREEDGRTHANQPNGTNLGHSGRRTTAKLHGTHRRMLSILGKGKYANELKRFIMRETTYLLFLHHCIPCLLYTSDAADE